MADMADIVDMDKSDLVKVALIQAEIADGIRNESCRMKRLLDITYFVAACGDGWGEGSDFREYVKGRKAAFGLL